MAKSPNNKASISTDLVAGLTASIPSVPDAMASGVLAGVSPIYGLYGLMIGTPIAALFTGSAFMSVVTTSAMAITIGTTLGGYQGQDQISALITIAIVIGIVQLAAGLLRLGFLVRYVSNAVMTGFLSGLGVLIVLSQLGDLTGYSSDFSSKVMASFDTLLHLGQVDLPTTIVGLTAIALIVILDRTRLRKFSMLIALLAVALLPIIFGWNSVLLVGDTASIPPGLPKPAIPTPIFDLDLITVGIAVAIIGLVQGAGISLGYPNPDGKYPDVSRDFVGQGIANLAVSFFQGLPVGGSLSSTALVVSAGAKSRLANIFTGLFAIMAVVLFAPLIERLPMAGLAAILVVAGVQSIKIPRIQTVWRTSAASSTMMVFTFVATLVLPIQYAVFLGVVLSFVLQIYRSAEKVDILEIVPLGEGRYEERPAPKQLPSNQVILLSPEGSLFFAGAAEFEEDLPDIEDAERTVVLVRLRGRDEIGSTFMRVIGRYAASLKTNRSKMVLVGVSEPVYHQLEKTGILDDLGRDNVYLATSILGDSSREALADAKQWLADEMQDIRPADNGS
ncbi:MAG: SulP family inorganic anion transporter [Anaerolineales bacterium]